jgi:surfeit locus 1 family protein
VSGGRWIQRRFRPAWPSTLAVLLAISAFLALGNWQLDRAAYKDALQRRYTAQGKEPILPIGEELVNPENVKFRRVTASGTYDSRYQVLLANKVYRSRLGYHVITPLQVAGGSSWLLVNRGWIPHNEVSPSSPALAAPAHPVTVRGQARVPVRNPIRLGDEPAPAGTGIVVWPDLDLSRYHESIPFALQPVVVLLDPDPDDGGLVREWQAPRLDTVHHTGYALQWFGFALLALAIYVWGGLRRARTRATEQAVAADRNMDERKSP